METDTAPRSYRAVFVSLSLLAGFLLISIGAPNASPVKANLRNTISASNWYDGLVHAITFGHGQDQTPEVQKQIDDEENRQDLDPGESEQPDETAELMAERQKLADMHSRLALQARFQRLKKEHPFVEPDGKITCLNMYPTGCNAIFDMELCLQSRDGRGITGQTYLGRKIHGEPCVWCGGEPCAPGNPSMCQPYDWVRKDEAFNETRAKQDFHVASCKEMSKMEPSLYCFVLMMPFGYEPALMRKQLAAGAGIFGCKESTVFSNVTLQLSLPGRPEVLTHRILSNLSVKYGGRWGTALNTEIFIKVWKAVVKLGRYMNHDWTIKVDSDTVFIPSRLALMLRWWPMSEEMVANAQGDAGIEGPPQNGTFLGNCKFDGMHGPIEVLSRNAVATWAAGYHACDDMRTKPFGEDKYIRRCLTRLGVNKEDEFNVLSELACAQQPWPCTARRVSFHPFKGIKQWFECWFNANQHGEWP